MTAGHADSVVDFDQERWLIAGCCPGPGFGDDDVVNLCGWLGPDVGRDGGHLLRGPEWDAGHGDMRELV